MSKLSSEVLELIAQETRVLTETYSSLESQYKIQSNKLADERLRARELTSNLVQTRRVEDKVQLYSDEAISHALTAAQKKEIDDIGRLLKSPYFARFKVRETRNGIAKEFEYKLGVATNHDCRIVDWRKAPISKLFYEYKEGDEYCEEIQGMEREGYITMRNGIEAKGNELKRFSCRLGEFENSSQGWRGTAEHSTSAGGLRSLLSLITADQFRLITEDAKSAVLIQGVAGSGKTTVALHRLAWMLHSDNSDLEAEECVVLVRHQALKTFVSNTLPEMQVHGVRIMTYCEWALQLVERSIGRKLTLSSTTTPHSIIRLKSSAAILEVLNQLPVDQDPIDNLLAIFNNPKAILDHPQAKLLDHNLINTGFIRNKELHQNNLIEPVDLASLLILVQRKYGGVPITNGQYGKLRHIVVDEAQDFSAIELASIVNSVDHPRELTVVGDISQRSSQSSGFPGWEELRTQWRLSDEDSQFISLNVSHRSTAPIINFAQAIAGERQDLGGRPGKPPLWYRCQSETHALTEAIGWLERVRNRFPNSLTAVICRDKSESKQITSWLNQRFAHSVRLGDEQNFDFDAGIVVTSVEEVKGLEFHSVLIWNPSRNSYSASNEDQALLYIAASRATDYLCVIGWNKPSIHLNDRCKRLARVVQD